MKILALEFSSEQRSVAVLVEGAIRGAASETGARNTRALHLIEQALQQADLEREDVQCLAVGLGPGSYAGIRAAIALAQGWQLARPVKVLGISSALGLAVKAQSEKIVGEVSLVIDAQRNEFYLARYEINASSLREMEPLRIATLAEIQARSDAGDIVVGPEATKWFSSGRIITPDAAALGMAATKRNDYVAGEILEPIYLRETAFVKAPPARVISL